MVTFNIPLVKPKIEQTYKRDWRKYDKNDLKLILEQKNGKFVRKMSKTVGTILKTSL